MPASTADDNHNKKVKVSIAPYWRWFLDAVGIGKSAVGGAGAAIALLGIAEIAVAIYAGAHSHAIQQQAVQYVAAIGAIIGGIVGCLAIIHRS